MGELVLVRHGETEWSRVGRHTGRTDLPLTAHGEEQAGGLSKALAGRPFALVLVSPRQRAQRTAQLAGLHPDAVEPDLAEWEYGDYEGITTLTIRETRPGWSIWTDGAPGGEAAADVGARADRVLDRVRPALEQGDVALVAHSHLLRVLIARWLGLPPADGRHFLLETGALSSLGFERENPVVQQLNVRG